MELKYTGIVLRKIDIGEADRLYLIYTQEQGKIAAKASGVRRASARLSAALESLNLLNFSISRTRGVGKITAAVAEESFWEIKNNLEKISRAFFVLGIFDNLTAFEVRDEYIFKLLLEYLEILRSLSTKESIKADLLDQAFIFKLLDFSGYKLEVNHCVNCGKKLIDKTNFFCAKQGGMLCEKCVSRLDKNFLIKASRNSIKLMRLFFSNDLRPVLKIKANLEEIENLKKISSAFLGWLGEANLVAENKIC